MLLFFALLVIIAEAVLLNFLRKSSKNREVVKAAIFMTLLITLIIGVNIDEKDRYDALRDSRVVPWIVCIFLLGLIFVDISIPENPISIVFRAWNRTTSNIFFVLMILTIVTYSVTNWTKQ
jgi:hypothetical protein